MGVRVRILATVLMLTPPLAASTKFVSTWINPVGGLIDFSGQKVAAFVMTRTPELRLGPEETLAAEMRRRGVNCVAGYTVLPVELAKDREKAAEFLRKVGITAAVLVRVVGDEKRTTYTPPTVWYTSGYYPTFWGYWNYAWTAVYQPGYLQTDKVWSIETLVYSIERDKLLWAGRSETTNPKNIRKFVKDVVQEAGEEMRKAGLVKK